MTTQHRLQRPHQYNNINLVTVSRFCAEMWVKFIPVQGIIFLVKDKDAYHAHCVMDKVPVQMPVRFYVSGKAPIYSVEVGAPYYLPTDNIAPSRLLCLLSNTWGVSHPQSWSHAIESSNIIKSINLNSSMFS